MFPLTKLPSELIALVAEQVSAISDLRSLALSSHRLQALVEPCLYRQLFFRGETQALRLLQAISSRPARAKSVHTVDCRCLPEAWDRGAAFESLANVVNRSPNLEELTFESPQCNTSEWETKSAWNRMRSALFQSFTETPTSCLDPPLHRLRKLTIHMNGADSPYWTLDASSLCILTHLTIEHLTISCVYITPDLHTHSTVRAAKATTQLKHLALIECNITPEGLTGMLSLPSALQSLYLGENCHNLYYYGNDIDERCNDLFERYPHQAVDALKQQKVSLRSLTYVAHQAGGIRRRPSPTPPQGAFSEFVHLEKVCSIGGCYNFEMALMSYAPPPSLKKLHLSREAGSLLWSMKSRSADKTSPLRNIPFLQYASTTPPCLSLVSIVIDCQNTPRIHDRRLRAMLRKQLEGPLEAPIKACAARGLTLEIFYQPASRYIPPLLHGESNEPERLFYASGGGGFVGASAAAAPPQSEFRLWENDDGRIMLEADLSSDEGDESGEDYNGDDFYTDSDTDTDEDSDEDADWDTTSDEEGEMRV